MGNLCALFCIKYKKSAYGKQPDYQMINLPVSVVSTSAFPTGEDC